MKKAIFLFVLLIVLTVQASTQASDQAVLNNRKSLGSTSTENKSVRPIQANASSALMDGESVAYGLKLFNLSIGAAGASGSRSCTVVVRNSTSQNFASARYDFTYWSRRDSSSAWVLFYGSLHTLAFTANSDNTVVLRMGMPEGSAPQLRVTMRLENGSRGSFLSEIVGTVPQ